MYLKRIYYNDLTMIQDFFNLLPSPIQEIIDEVLTTNNIRLFIKRDDLIHASISGNKARKLKYNLLAIEELGYKRLLTFGGAFSNHIHATAAAGKEFGIETIGIIRGDTPLASSKDRALRANNANRLMPTSPTLEYAEKCGMKLYFVSRTDFRHPDLIIQKLQNELGKFYLLPEGGSNKLAIKGCREIIEEINLQMLFKADYFCCACGTGATLAGIIAAANNNQQVIGFSALKGDFLQNDVQNLLHQENSKGINWNITDNYCFGGYSKWRPELIHFINDFKSKYGIAIDPIYTGKMFFGIFDLIKKNYFKPNTIIVAIHTGGLQGIEGFNKIKLKNSNLIMT
jgi:1-aminocyclopropane-1-carboxylate deaminase